MFWCKKLEKVKQYNEFTDNNFKIFQKKLFLNVPQILPATFTHNMFLHGADFKMLTYELDCSTRHI